MNKNIQIESLSKNEESETFKITLNLPQNLGWYEDVIIVINKDNNEDVYPLKFEQSENGIATFTGEITLPTSAIYHYYFMCKINGKSNYIKKDSIDDIAITKKDMFKISSNFSVPDWAKGKVMYHIFVDRFNRKEIEKEPLPRRHLYSSFKDDMQLGPDNEGIWNNDFYGGDLKGIIDKLDYIKDLGVTILYLSPIVRSQSNHRYDTADYLEVDPYAGSNDDLKLLCEEAHKRGMKVILDAVFNHTGNDSKYFNEYNTYNTVGAYQNMDSEYSSFYKKHLENGQVIYDYWWGMPNLPVCDGTSSTWRNFITGEGGVIDKWFSLGIDGLRLDVADELTDEFIELIRKAVKRNKEDGFILGEVWKNPMRMNRSYISSGKAMDSVMNYPLVDALIRYYKYSDKEKLERVLNELITEYPKDTLNSLMNFTSTHDITRLINIFGSDDFRENTEWAWNPINSELEYCRCHKLTEEQYKKSKEILMSYIFALTFLPGNLSIFYGDEAGVEGLGNLSNRKPFPWDNIDKELLNYFRYIGNIKKNEHVLKEGNLEIIDINPNTLTFERTDSNEKILVTVNRSEDEQNLIIPSEYNDEKSHIYTIKKQLIKTIPPLGAVAIKKYN